MARHYMNLPLLVAVLLSVAIADVAIEEQEQFCDNPVDEEYTAILEDDAWWNKGHINLLQQKVLKKAKPTAHGLVDASQNEKYTTSTTTYTGVTAPKVCSYAEASDYAQYTSFYEESAALWLCQDYVHDWTKYVNGLDVGGGAFVPMYASEDLTAVNEKIERVTIFIHGGALNPQWFFCLGMQAAALGGNAESTLVIAPFFADMTYKSSNWSSNVDPNLESVCWQDAPYATGLDYGFANTVINLLWDLGGNSIPRPDGTTISSLQVIDLLVAAFLPNGRYAKSVPNLQKISLIGFSSGGHLCHYWSFFSPLAASPNVQVMLGDLNHYLYLDDNRPVPSCRELRNTSIHFFCTDFEVPAEDACDAYATSKGVMHGWGLADINDPDYRAWPFGLKISNPAWFLQPGGCFEYVGSILSNATLVEELIRDFPKKLVFQVQGARDVCNCGIHGYHNDQDSTCYPTQNPPSIPTDLSKPDCAGNFFGGSVNGFMCCDTWPDSFTDDNVVDAGSSVATGGCSIMLMGSNRLQRANNYASYLRLYYDKFGVNFHERRIFYFNGTHNSSAFATSPPFQELVY